jgi:myosin heavy subunit
MFSAEENDDTSAIGWISISDLLMVGLMGVLLTVVAGNAARKIAVERAQGLEMTLDEQARRLKDKETELEKMIASLHAARLELKDAEKLQDDYDSLLRKARQTEELLAREQQLLMDKDKQLTESLAALDQARSDLMAARTDLSETQLQLLEAKRAAKEAEMKLAESERRLLELQKYVADTKIPDQRQMAAWKQMEKDYAALKKQHAMLDAELAEARRESLRLEDAVADLEAELKKYRDEQITAEVREQGFRQELLGIRTRDSGYGRVVFVVDCSGSMVRSSNTSAESRWDYVQTVIRNWLLLLPFQEVQLVMFNNEVDVYPRRGDFLKLQSTAVSRRMDIQPLLTALRETVPNEGTNTALALQTAYQTSNVDAIFLFTDGQPMLKAEVDTTSEDFRILQNEVLDMIVREKERGNSTPINVIGLGDYFSTRLSGADQKHLPFGVFLTRIAQLSGGTFLGR